MADIVVYRTYPFKEKEQDPILKDIEEAIEKEGLTKKPSIIKELSGVSTSTLHNWLQGKTRCPRYATVVAVFGALGYHPSFDRTSKFDLEAERADAKRWNLRKKAALLAAQERKSGKRKTGRNGEARPSA